MDYGFLDIAATPSVRAQQAKMGSDRLWASGRHDRPSRSFTEDEVAFIATRDSFYLASVSETGWPYVQHRGGKPGFVKVLDETTLAFADYSGNRQYISAGNAEADDRVCLIMMDYPRRARLKIYAHLEVVDFDADPELYEKVIGSDLSGRPERIFRLRLETFDWNCPKHITPRYTAAEIAPTIGALQSRILELEAEVAALQARAAGES